MINENPPQKLQEPFKTTNYLNTLASSSLPIIMLHLLKCIFIMSLLQSQHLLTTSRKPDVARKWNLGPIAALINMQARDIHIQG